jgi:3-deoxy-D-manno-octulosonic acid kinase
MPQEHKSANCHILQASGLNQHLDSGHFDPGHWREQEGFRQRVGGRGGTCMIELDGRRAVLRRYHRGGLVGRFLYNQYLWLGKNLSRPWREWKVLELARAAGLPAPEPLAACICRSGLSYRAALITAYLENTEMLTERLERTDLGADVWYALGQLVKRMHDAGIRHADLTSDNVLIDNEDRFYLIDFDQARVMKRLDDWQWRPLLRFRRSIEKRDRRRKLYFGENDWQALMDGYQS